MRAGEAVIWANRFDHDAADILSLQDKVAAAIVAQVDPLLLLREGERAASRNPRGVSARDLVLQAVPAIYRMDRLSFHAAGELLEAALRVDPSNTDALAWYAYWHLFLVGQGWAEDPDAATRRAGELADAAVAMDPNDARALTLAGHVRGFLLRRPSEAAVLHDRAISLNPNLAIAWCFSGSHIELPRRPCDCVDPHGQGDRALPLRSAFVLLPVSDHHAASVAWRVSGGRGGRPRGDRTQSVVLVFVQRPTRGAWTSGATVKEAASVMARLLRLEPDFTHSGRGRSFTNGFAGGCRALCRKWLAARRPGGMVTFWKWPGWPAPSVRSVASGATRHAPVSAVRANVPRITAASDRLA